MKTIRTLGLLVMAAVLVLLGGLWLPVTPRWAAHPLPARSYAEALHRVTQLQALELADLFPECRSLLLTHAAPTARVLVLFHGATSCPAQVAALGQAFYALGYNVLIPRLPHHGRDDPMTTEVARLTAEELVAAADIAVDIAAGLGEEVTVVGFSAGGALAAWVAQERPDVARTVLLSPFLSPRVYPAWLIRPLARGMLLAPNAFWWWDPTLHAEMPGPRYAYPRYPTHAMAQIMRLSLAVRRRAQRQPPRSAAILVVTNASVHENVDNAVTARLVADWQQWAIAPVATFELDASLDLEHNYVDPAAPNQPVDVTEVVHPRLIEQIDRLAWSPP